MFQTAPLLFDAPQTVADFQSYWVPSVDQKKLRIAAALTDNAWGCVHLLNGRTEYIEKYSHVIADLNTAGLHVITLDWRGQGLSERAGKYPMAGHVEHFEEYQNDVDAAWVVHNALIPKALPVYLIGHSMGGLISTRRLLLDSRYQAAMLSGPMHGIRLFLFNKIFAPLILRVTRPFVDQDRIVFGRSDEGHVLKIPFKNNPLTYDEQIYEKMRREIREAPDLALGGPSFSWLRAAFDEIKSIADAPAPETPALIYLGEEERIVSPTAIRKQAAKWDNAELVILPKTKHECLMESPPLRQMRVSETVEFFKTYQ